MRDEPKHQEDLGMTFFRRSFLLLFAALTLNPSVMAQSLVNVQTGSSTSSTGLDITYVSINSSGGGWDDYFDMPIPVIYSLQFRFCNRSNAEWRGVYDFFPHHQNQRLQEAIDLIRQDPAVDVRTSPSLSIEASGRFKRLRISANSCQNIKREFQSNNPAGLRVLLHRAQTPYEYMPHGGPLF
jgi:hypothetical protein